MKKLLIFTLILSLSSCQSLRVLSGKPSASDIDLAVRQLMGSSIFQTLNTLEKLQQENPEMLLPEELRPALQTLRLAGYGAEIDTIYRRLGSVSVIAMTEMREVMKESIAATKFTDGVAILLDGQDAAIQVLKNVSLRPSTYFFSLTKFPLLLQIYRPNEDKKGIDVCSC